MVFTMFTQLLPSDISLPCTAETIVESKKIKNISTNINDIPTPEAVTQELISKIDALLNDEISVVEIPTEVGVNTVFSLISHIICSSRQYAVLSFLLCSFRVWINKSVPLYMTGYAIDIMAFWIHEQLPVRFEFQYRIN